MICSDGKAFGRWYHGSKDYWSWLESALSPLSFRHSPSVATGLTAASWGSSGSRSERGKFWSRVPRASPYCRNCRRGQASRFWNATATALSSIANSTECYARKGSRHSSSAAIQRISAAIQPRATPISEITMSSCSRTARHRSHWRKGRASPSPLSKCRKPCWLTFVEALRRLRQSKRFCAPWTQIKSFRIPPCAKRLVPAPTEHFTSARGSGAGFRQQRYVCLLEIPKAPKSVEFFWIHGHSVPSMLRLVRSTLSGVARRFRSREVVEL